MFRTTAREWIYKKCLHKRLNQDRNCTQGIYSIFRYLVRTCSECSMNVFRVSHMEFRRFGSMFTPIFPQRLKVSTAVIIKFLDQNSLQNACSSVLVQNFKLEKLSYNAFFVCPVSSEDASLPTSFSTRVNNLWYNYVLLIYLRIVSIKSEFFY